MNSTIWVAVCVSIAIFFLLLVIVVVINRKKRQQNSVSQKLHKKAVAIADEFWSLGANIKILLAETLKSQNADEMATKNKRNQKSLFKIKWLLF
jgi:hypothetical protein